MPSLAQELDRTANSFKSAAYEAEKYARALQRLNAARKAEDKKSQVKLKNAIKRRGNIYGGPR